MLDVRGRAHASGLRLLRVRHRWLRCELARRRSAQRRAAGRRHARCCAAFVSAHILDGNGAIIEHSGAVSDGAFHSVFGPLVDAAQAHATLVEPFKVAKKLEVAFDVKVSPWDASSLGVAVLAQIVTSPGGPLVSFAITGNGKAHLDVGDGTQAYAVPASVDLPLSRYGASSSPRRSGRVVRFISLSTGPRSQPRISRWRPPASRCLWRPPCSWAASTT
jgi:hypothetical protein